MNKADVNLSKKTKAPLQFSRDLMVWACWLYYEEGMTQGEIAESLGVSRATVNTYLSDARQQGIVNISIEKEAHAAISLSQRLKSHFGLEDALIIPSAGAEVSLIDRLGYGGAQVLMQLLRSGESVAISWGRTMLALAHNVKSNSLNDLKIVQATGVTNIANDYSPEACATILANNLKGRYIPISAPAIASSPQVRAVLHGEPLLKEQLLELDAIDHVLFGISSLRPNSTIHSSGFFESTNTQHEYYAHAVASVMGRFLDSSGQVILGPLEDRLTAMSIEQVKSCKTRIAVAGGFDKISAILSTLRGGLPTILVSDVATCRGLLMAEGVDMGEFRAPLKDETNFSKRSKVKKLINRPIDVVDEAIEGALLSNQNYIKAIDGSLRALVAKNGPRAGKVGLVIGGGSGHEPCFYGYLGKGLADAAAIGNIFASPPPDPIMKCTRAASGGAGVLFIYGNYSGDVMNFDMAAELMALEGVEVRTILTTDDVASSHFEDRDGRRGLAGNILIFKAAGAACDLGYDLETCERIARKANANCFTIGVGLEPCSLPDSRKPSFDIGENDIEIGVGIHGEPGIERQSLKSADDIADLMIDRLLIEISGREFTKLALLVNSLGGTPLHELYIITRRIRKRLSARNIEVHINWTGHYCTSLDMIGVSVSVMLLDDELERMLDHPCDSQALKVFG